MTMLGSGSTGNSGTSSEKHNPIENPAPASSTESLDVEAESDDLPF